jgi:hypothetical protein
MRIRIPEYEQADNRNICFRRGARSSSDGRTRVQLLGLIEKVVGERSLADAHSYFHYAASFYFVGLRPIHGQEPPASNDMPAPGT